MGRSRSGNQDDINRNACKLRWEFRDLYGHGCGDANGVVTVMPLDTDAVHTPPIEQLVGDAVAHLFGLFERRHVDQFRMSSTRNKSSAPLKGLAHERSPAPANRSANGSRVSSTQAIDPLSPGMLKKRPSRPTSSYWS